MQSNKQPNLGRLATIFDVNQIFRAYSQVFAGQVPTPFKIVNDIAILRNAKGEAVLFDSSVFLGPKQAQRIEDGTLAKKIAENVFETAINLLTQQIDPNDVPDKVNLCFAVCHNLEHWTGVVVNLDNFRAGYKKMYDECIRLIPTNKNAATFTHNDLHQTRNIVLANLGIIRLNPGTDPTYLMKNQEQNELFLRTFAKNIHVRHFDSIASPHYNTSIAQSLKNKFNLTQEYCAGQEGQTCGDHSVYNIMRVSLLNNPPQPNEKPVDSRQLRMLTEALTPAASRLMDQEADTIEANERLHELNQNQQALTRAQLNAAEQMMAPAIPKSNNTPAPVPAQIDTRLTDFENTMVDALIELRRLFGYSAVDIILTIIELPNSISLNDLIIAVNGKNKGKENFEPIVFSEEGKKAVDNLANLIEGKVKFSNTIDHDVLICIAINTAQEFALSIQQESMSAMAVNASKKKQTIQPDTFTATKSRVDITPKPPTPTQPVTVKPTPKPIMTEPKVPSTPIETRIVTPAAATTVRRRIVAPAITQSEIPPAVGTPHSVPFIEPTAPATPQQNQTSKRGPLFYVGMAIGISLAIALGTAVVIGLAYTAIFTVPVIVAITLATVLVGAIGGLVAGAILAKKDQAESNYSHTDGTYSKFSEKMPLVREPGVKHTSAPDIKNNPADIKQDNAEDKSNKNNFRPFRK